MKILKRVGLAVVAVLAILVIVSLFLPREATVSRSIEIAAPPAAIFPLVGDLRRFNEWSPWAERDPAAVFTFTGPVDGIGQTMNWTSKVPELGAGSMSLTRLDPDREVEMSLDLGRGGRATADLLLAASGALTVVTWSFRADLGYNPVARYFGLMMDGMVGPDFDKGLARLKVAAEGPKPST